MATPCSASSRSTPRKDRILASRPPRNPARLRTRFVVGVLPDARSPRPDGGDELDRLRAAAATGALRFELAVVMGRFRPIAEIRIGARLPVTADALRPTAWSAGAGLERAGV
jgi:hypothetical protein